MRHSTFGLRVVRGAVLAAGLGAILTVLPIATAPSQPPGNRGDRPGGEAGGSSLARYVPEENLVTYLESQGVDAHPDAWRKTAASQLLNRTSLGAVLEEIGREIAERSLARIPDRSLRGTDVTAAMEHLLRSGFVFAVNARAGAEKPDSVVLVIRNAARGDARGLSQKFLNLAAQGDQKPKTVTKPGGRTVSVLGGGTEQESVAWWTEGDDLVFALAVPESVDRIIETLDGKRPGAARNAAVRDLARAEGGFQPITFGFLDIGALPKPSPDAVKLGLDGVKRVTYRWGFQDEALMSVLAADAPAPRKGLLAMLDQPAFSRDSLPALPAELPSFTVVSMEPAKLLDRSIALAKEMNPEAANQIEPMLDAIHNMTGVRLKEDLLAHLGPTMVLSVLPPKRTIAPSLSFLGGLGSLYLQTPRASAVIETDDPAALGKTLDQLAQVANRAMKGGPPNPEQAGDAGGKPLVAEFRALKAPEKGYELEVPPGVFPLPSGLRPTFMIGRKSLVIATAPETARVMLAAESGRAERWTPRGDLVRVFDRLPPKMTFLSFSDPRDTLFPELLTNLPSLVQSVAMLSESNTRPRVAPVQPGGQVPGAGNLSRPDRFRLRILPDDIPDPEVVRKYLFPGYAVMTVDDRGFRLVTRDALPSFDPTTVPMSSGPVMVALLLPAVQSAREAARRAQCTNNMKQIGLAMHNYNSVNNTFPPAAITDKDGKPLLSWRVAILPFLEQQALFNEFKLDEPWDSPHNKKLIEKMPMVYACPSLQPKEPFTTPYRVIEGKGAIFEGTKGRAFAEIIDGTSNTLLVVEAAGTVPWTKPDTSIPFDPDPNKPLPKFGGKAHPGGFNALFADGSVRFIKQTINEAVLRALITCNGGEVVNPAEF